jgi:hypothetical protein
VRERIAAYGELGEEGLWRNLEKFLKKVIPVAEECGVRMAIHPDDPPYPIFGIPRIITSEANLDRFLKIVDSPANSLCLCTGSLGCAKTNDIPKMVRKYAASVGKTNKDVTVIVAHLGGGSSVSLHCKGNVIDCNDALGGDGPISTERAGSVPGFPLVDKCFSGQYTRQQVRKRLAGRGGAIAYFNTNDFREIIAMAKDGNEEADVFIKGYCLSAAKYVASLAATACGKVDAIVLTGGVCHSDVITGQIIERVSFIAPVVVYPGEDELESLAENGYGILAGKFEIKEYNRERIIEN